MNPIGLTERGFDLALMLIALVLIGFNQQLLAALFLAAEIVLVAYRQIRKATPPAPHAPTAAKSDPPVPPPPATIPYTERPSTAQLTSAAPQASVSPLAQNGSAQAADDILKRANERLRVAIESARDGVLILDEAGNLVECNPAAQRMLGIDRERFFGKPFVEMLSEMMNSNELNGFGYTLEDIKELARPLRIQQARITRRQFMSSVLTNNGLQKIYIEEIGSPVYASGSKVIGRLLVLRDMTEHETLLDFRDQVTHMIVHDLRGPLTAILNGIDLTLVTESPLSQSESQRILRLCLDSGNSLMRQIESLLDIANIESNTLPIKAEAVSINDIVATAYDALANTFIEMRITMENRLPDNLPKVLVDPDIMRRVFTNLIDNALRFTMRGKSIRIDADLTPADRSAVVVSISDNGPGIPPDQRQAIFETFRRVPSTTPLTGRRGFGLGLTFCKLAIDAHGGKIWIEDATDGMTGARFIVRLPVSR